MAINKRFTQLNNSGSNHNLLDAYSGKITGSFEVTGAAYFAGGLSGSLTKLVDGSDYLLAGPYITLATNSLGQIEITGSAGAASPEYWSSTTAASIFTTGSVLIRSDDGSGTDAASDYGTDTFFFVSGAIDGVTDGNGVAAFGGDVVVSGNLYISGVNPNTSLPTGLYVFGDVNLYRSLNVGLSATDIASFSSQLTASAGIATPTIGSSAAVTVISPLTASVGLEVSPAGTGRGLLNFGGLDIGPITGSNYVVSVDGTGYLSGSILSASNGVFDGTFGATVRHEFHIIAAAPDINSNINSFAATYLVMSSIASSTGIQKVRSVTELSRETSGSYAENWDVNITEDGVIELTSSMDSGVIYWYAQRTKEMSINIVGSLS